MTAQVVTEEGVTLEKLTRVFIKIRERRTQLTAEFKQIDADLVAQQDNI